ncbi:glycosyltransferase family 2 protein [Paenibacillus beijingensis]|uniref:Glycosyl transferase family 2 n=1 Tax=Paenibacillus beijingensis TaxID=1126833 RepID=A0A0D5NRL0_9BACL|nr:glycosyltransferase family 2 protein [Paenibacillus beijingensis]AJY77612.1 glycosyl transferase family 2 [Paenibacillus beijingensis]
MVVFLPAYNEEMNVAEVLPRVPRRIGGGWVVEVIVVDDGSTDGTVQAALAAGADAVLELGRNRGLGAAVRAGMAECVRRGADIGFMIDADNEYPPEQIPEVAAPIMDGTADYTMGSRFKGTIAGMKLHRRLGNVAFTLLQCVLLRRVIWDGQSGMRAFSREAMKAARIVHDYNYAQVLTLNLVRQGFRMVEVPIRYRVRTKGQSFIRFGAYMKAVVPAIWKEMRTPARRNVSKRQQADASLRRQNGLLGSEEGR